MNRWTSCFNCEKIFYNKQKHNQIFCSVKCRIECWSRKYKCCVKCGTTKIKHARLGYCRKCAWYLPQVQEWLKIYRKSTKYKKLKKEQERRYAKSPKGIITRKKTAQKYIKTEKGKAKYRRYRETEDGRIMFQALFVVN